MQTTGGDELDDKLLAVVAVAAEGLNGRPTAVERDLENALDEALSSASLPATTQVRAKLDSWNGRLGPFDLTVDDADGLACLELKWGTDLSACAWDAAKLSTTLAEKKATRAYLIAGAPKTTWEEFAPGVELFMSRAWRAEALLSTYAAGFAFWRTDVANHPRAVQGQWKMIARDGRDLDLVVGGIDHQIRVVEIVIDGPDLQPVSYVPVVASWKRGGRSASVATPPPAALGIEADKQVKVKSVKQARAVVGEPQPLAGGEGFSASTASPHFAITNEAGMRGFLDEEVGETLEKPVSLHRFASPTARRAWLIRRRQLAEPWPEVFRIKCGTSFPVVSNIGIERNALSYEHQGMGVELVSQRIHPSDQQWLRLWAELDRIGIWSWWPSYTNENAQLDDYGWSIAIAIGGRMVEACGYMAYPQDGGVSEEPSPEWGEFQAALQRLVGGLPIA